MIPPFRLRPIQRLLACLAVLAAAPAMAQEGDVAQIADLPLEQLLRIDVVSASRMAKQISDAPSAVSIVTADDIRTFGYRTLSDILDSMRGLSMAHDNYFGFLSGRGYADGGASLGGYAGRITLLIDGYRAPDNFLGQVYYGQDGLLDVELIDRVEYIPGNGSSSYGDSAFLGVINIVTKHGKDIGAAEAATEFGSHGWKRNRVTLGKQFDNGLDVVLSVSDWRAAGRDPKSDDLFDYVGKLDKGSNQRYFLKATYGSWLLESAWATAYPGSILPDSYGKDRFLVNNSFTRLKFDHDLAEHLKTSVDLYYGQFRIKEHATWTDGVDWYNSYDQFGGDWRGVDVKFVGTWFDRHTLVWGSEYRSDFNQRYWAQTDGVLYTSHWFKRRTNSFYAYDDIALASNLRLNIGARQDKRDNGSETLSPRGALVYSPLAGTTLRYSVGRAHRQRTPYEEWAAWPLPLGTQVPVESMGTKELVWEQMVGDKTRITTSVYRYRNDQFWLDTLNGWVDGNVGTLYVRGGDTELEHVWDNGMHLRTSYAYQDSHFQDGSRLLGLARHVAKFNLGIPLDGERLKLGLAARYLGRRLNYVGDYEPGVLVGDLTLSAKWNNWFGSFSVRNIGNAAYNEVSSALVTPQGVTPADRRNFWFQLGYEFK